MALPLYDSERIFQEVKTFQTASMRGSQLAASISPKPIKIPRTFIISHDQSMATGRSERPLQDPNQGHLHLLFGTLFIWYNKHNLSGKEPRTVTWRCEAFSLLALCHTKPLIRNVRVAYNCFLKVSRQFLPVSVIGNVNTNSATPASGIPWNIPRISHESLAYTRKVQVEYSTVDTVYHEQALHNSFLSRHRKYSLVNAINATYAPRAMKRFGEYVIRSIMERIFSIVIGCIF